MSPPINERIEDSLPPVLSSLLGKSKSISDYTSKLPADSQIRAQIQSKLEEIKASKSNLTEMDERHFKIFATDDPTDKYDKYLDIIELSSGLKIEFDNIDSLKRASAALSDDSKVEVAWMSNMITDPTMSEFAEYLKSRLSAHINTQIQDELIFIGIADQSIKRDIDVLKQVYMNQTYTYDSMLKWEEYLDEQLGEKDGLYKKLTELRTTQQRESLFNVTDIKNISKWKARIEIAFAILLFVLIGIVCIKFYSSKIKTFVNDKIVRK